MNAGTVLLGASSVGDRFADTAANGALLAAIGVAALAGVVSFLSPCMLPLAPAYLSYVTGMSGAQLESPDARQRGHVVLGVLLFVLGFAAVFVSLGALFGGVGYELGRYSDWINRVAGVLTIVFGLAFLGVVPGLDRTWRLRAVPKIGLAGAPLFGVVFGLGWLPCIGPTLAAVLTLSASAASAGRGAVLTGAYALGLGVPFLLLAVASQRALAAFGWARRHAQAITRLGGVMLVALGVLLVTGAWESFTTHMYTWVSGVQTVI